MNNIFVHIVGKGPPLVLIHGWGWHSGIWHPLIQPLKTNYQLFLVDLPGFGKSPLLSKEYDFQSIFNQLQPHLPEKAAWLGWSLGGLLCQWVAIHAPKTITQLITVASTPKFIAEDAWPGVSAQTLAQFSHTLTHQHQQTLQDFLTLQLRGSLARHELLKELHPLIDNTIKPTLEALHHGLNLLKETDLRHDLKKIQCPSLHIFGQLDTLVPVAVVEKFAALHPSGRFELIKRTGHIPFLTHQSEFLTLLNNFCE